MGFPPQNQLVTTPVASDVVKEVFLDRLVKEIVQPYLASTTKNQQNQTEHIMINGKLKTQKVASTQETHIKAEDESSTEGKR